MNNTRDAFVPTTGRFSCAQPNLCSVPSSEEDFFGIGDASMLDVPFEYLTEEELQLAIRDLRSIKSNEVLRGTKE